MPRGRIPTPANLVFLGHILSLLPRVTETLLLQRSAGGPDVALQLLRGGRAGGESGDTIRHRHRRPNPRNQHQNHRQLAGESERAGEPAGTSAAGWCGAGRRGLGRGRGCRDYLQWRRRGGGGAPSPPPLSHPRCGARQGRAGWGGAGRGGAGRGGAGRGGAGAWRWLDLCILAGWPAGYCLPGARGSPPRLPGPPFLRHPRPLPVAQGCQYGRRFFYGVILGAQARGGVYSRVLQCSPGGCGARARGGGPETEVRPV